jgi:arginase
MTRPRPADVTRLIDIIGVPFDLGASRRGSRSGPEALRSAGLKTALEALGHTVRDFGDVSVVPAGAEESGGPGHPRYVVQVSAMCRFVADAVELSLASGAFPLIVGGDHSLAIGALAGAARAKGAGGVIWLDAHADMNTPATSPTGNIHGMSMAAALGEMADLFPPPGFPTPAVHPNRCVFVGLRDLDPGERSALREKGMSCFTMTDIDRTGMPKVIERAIEIAGRGPGSVHVSLDIDVLDPATAPGTGTPVAGGITYREAHVAMEIIAESGIAHSMEVVEVNPALDDGIATAGIAVELICSALGKSIL